MYTVRVKEGEMYVAKDWNGHYLKFLNCDQTSESRQFIFEVQKPLTHLRNVANITNDSVDLEEALGDSGQRGDSGKGHGVLEVIEAVCGKNGVFG